MPDIVEKIISKASTIAELAKRLGNAELLLEISDLKLQLADLKTEHANLKDEIRELKDDKEERANNPLQYTGVVYRDAKNRPFCPACYDERKKRIHLSFFQSARGSHIFNCPVCHAAFEEFS